MTCCMLMTVLMSETIKGLGLSFLNGSRLLEQGFEGQPWENQGNGQWWHHKGWLV